MTTIPAQAFVDGAHPVDIEQNDRERHIVAPRALELFADAFVQRVEGAAARQRIDVRGQRLTTRNGAASLLGLKQPGGCEDGVFGEGNVPRRQRWLAAARPEHQGAKRAAERLERNRGDGLEVLRREGDHRPTGERLEERAVGDITDEQRLTGRQRCHRFGPAFEVDIGVANLRRIRGRDEATDGSALGVKQAADGAHLDGVTERADQCMQHLIAVQFHRDLLEYLEELEITGTRAVDCDSRGDQPGAQPGDQVGRIGGEQNRFVGAGFGGAHQVFRFVGVEQDNDLRTGGARGPERLDQLPAIVGEAGTGRDHEGWTTGVLFGIVGFGHLKSGAQQVTFQAVGSTGRIARQDNQRPRRPSLGRNAHTGKGRLNAQDFGHATSAG